MGRTRSPLRVQPLEGWRQALPPFTKERGSTSRCAPAQFMGGTLHHAAGPRCWDSTKRRRLDGLRVTADVLPALFLTRLRYRGRDYPLAGLVDNHLALILPGMFTAYGTFLVRQFLLLVPRALEEAAIEGAGCLRRFVAEAIALTGLKG